MKNPQISIVNSTLRVSGDSVTLTRLLASHYETLEAAERHQFVTALIMEVGACSALMKAQKNPGPQLLIGNQQSFRGLTNHIDDTSDLRSQQSADKSALFAHERKR